MKKHETVAIFGNASLGEEIDLDNKDLFIVGSGVQYDEVLKEICSNPNPEQDVVLFEIHTRETRKPDYIEFLKEVKSRVLMQKKHDDIKMSEEYPLEEIIKTFNTRYFLCTFCYMLAYAIAKGYKRIEIYKSNMCYSDDYIQKYNFEFWLGIAKGFGAELVLTPQTDLLKCKKLYGYEAINTLGVAQDKYIKELRKKAKINIYESKRLLSEAFKRLKDSEESLRMLDSEHITFMAEILHRHGLNPAVEEKEEGSEEEIINMILEAVPEERKDFFVDYFKYLER